MGDYLLQVDPDDRIESTMLEDLYNEAINNNLDMVICDYLEHSNGRTFYHSEKPQSFHPKEVMKEMFTSLKGSFWNKLIRRSCFEKYSIKIPEDLILLEDLYTIFQLLLYPIKIGYIPKALYHYDRNTNRNSITNSNNGKIKDSIEGICRHFPELLKPYPEYWKLWIEHEMPWIAYTALYNDIFDPITFKEFFSSLRAYQSHNINERIVNLALWNYRLGLLVIKIRRELSSFFH